MEVSFQSALVTQGVLVQSPELEAHDKVLDNNPDGIGIWECRFFGKRGKPEYPEKTSQSKDDNQNTLSPHMTPEIEPGPHWLEASALTTAPSLLPK